MATTAQRQIVFRPDLRLYLFWDSRYGKYYYYDRHKDQLVYEDKSRWPRPSDVPATYYSEPYAQPDEDPSTAYGTSPGQFSNSSFTLSFAGGLQPHGSPTTAGTKPNMPLSGSNSSLSSLQPVLHQPMPVEPQMSSKNGLKVVEAVDEKSRVKTYFATEPKHRITDGSLLRQGIESHRMMLGTAGQSEKLFPGFAIRVPGRKFFVVGRVFLVLWVEPAGDSHSDITTMTETVDPGTTTSRWNERVFSKVRRFVVIREGTDYCSALPIMTYGGKGVGKAGIIKSDHAIIFTDAEPTPLPNESRQPHEQGMRATAIRVTAVNKPREKLDPVSRINFAKIHTIQHNIKVKDFGMVHPRCKAALMDQFTAVWHPGDSEESDSALDGDPLPGKSNAIDNGGGIMTPLSSVMLANHLRASFKWMTSQGATTEQALGALAAQLRKRTPSLSWEAAVQKVRCSLIYGDVESHSA
ncbi:hypothetical protein Slin15195_G061560 [Septoria linicola]|uniref:DUF6590 domain-containing protein n=1 Tax=Septoria linicola TaxID=215465 RepID=A0A9Q9ANN9_9PEZI|nr:hypothetical protein Slin14017_G077360 [Septoria linicola]USW52837.1 hypothetical protein Slin15195_G061560 [Septoria linicola]